MHLSHAPSARGHAGIVHWVHAYSHAIVWVHAVHTQASALRHDDVGWLAMWLIWCHVWGCLVLSVGGARHTTPHIVVLRTTQRADVAHHT